MLEAIVENFQPAMAEAPTPQETHLLRRLVKKVLVRVSGHFGLVLLILESPPHKTTPTSPVA